MSKKRAAIHQPFEGREPSGRFAKITHDMMKSPAWQALNLRQRGLYLELKARYAQKVMRGVVVESNRDEIVYPQSEWKRHYGDYRTFKGDMECLVNLGFIRITFKGKNVRQPNKYGFTDEWQDWKSG